MPFQGPYNTDWIYATASNAHVANHRDWFSNYTPFASRTEVPNGSGTEVAGVGDVQLEVNTRQPLDGGGSYHSLILRDVLHVPEALVNVVAAMEVEGFTSCRFGQDAEITNPDTGIALLLDRSRFYKLWLVGQPKGQTSLDSSSAYWINVTWSEAERARWEAYKRGESGGNVEESNGMHKRTHSAIPSSSGQSGKGRARKKSKKRNKKQNSEKSYGQELQDQSTELPEQNGQKLEASSGAGRKPPRYSAAEKVWLKANYGNEFKFLQAHGLKIFKKDNRKEGEQIVRSMMSQSGGEHASPNAAASRLGDLNLEPMARIVHDDVDLSVPPYTKLEKRWLHNGYGGESQFLRRSGLDIKSKRDRLEGQRRVRAMMHDDGTYEEPSLADMDRESRDAVMSAIMFGTRPY